jgi:hypothetical protein
MEPMFVTKMSVKGIGCMPNQRPEDGTRLLICRIFGKADGIKVGEDASGNVWQALKGSFAAFNLQTGQEYRSGKLFLPTGIHETVEAGVLALGENKEGLTIDFALEIFAVKASNPIGYSYQAVNLMPPTANDELSGIRAMIAEKRPQLAGAAAPAPAQITAPKDAAKKGGKK